MNIITIVLTAFALAMDAFAVSVTKGMTLKNLTKGNGYKNSFIFWSFSSSYAINWMVAGNKFSGIYKGYRPLDCLNIIIYFRW